MSGYGSPIVRAKEIAVGEATQEDGEIVFIEVLEGFEETVVLVAIGGSRSGEFAKGDRGHETRWMETGNNLRVIGVMLRFNGLVVKGVTRELTVVSKLRLTGRRAAGRWLRRQKP